MPSPFDKTLWVVPGVHMQERTAVVDPDLSWRKPHVEHQPAHLVSACPAAIVRIKKRDARRRNRERIAGGSRHCIEDLLSLRLRQATEPPPRPAYPPPNQRRRLPLTKTDWRKRGQQFLRGVWKLTDVDDVMCVVLSDDNWTAVFQGFSQLPLEIRRVRLAFRQHVTRVRGVQLDVEPTLTRANADHSRNMRNKQPDNRVSGRVDLQINRMPPLALAAEYLCEASRARIVRIQAHTAPAFEFN